MQLKIYFEDDPRWIDDTDAELQRFKRIKAAGGLVLNDAGEVLMIYRRNRWDLPKGKFEEGESIEECAEREVMEETGLRRLERRRPIIVSYHTYTEKKTQYLKETHWFLFTAPGAQPLAPQVEEDITQIEWVPPARLADYASRSYGLISDVLRAAHLL